MLIWIPVDRKDRESAKVTPLLNSEKWALIDFERGEIQSVKFFDNREEFGDWVDFVVLENKFESYIDFMEEGMMVLCVRDERTIDEIMEAFKFKELDEVGL